jgi:activator of HSP90 ATPase
MAMAATGLIRQRITVRAPPKAVYETLVEGRRHAKLIGAQASIQKRAGGAFSMWDGAIHGTTLALVPGKRIIQSWRCAMAGWPAGHFSRLTYTLTALPGGTAVTLTQADVPVACIAEIKQGWHDNYWTPLKRMLEGRV